MSEITDRLTADYPNGHFLPATKETALAELDSLRRTIGEMSEFEAFPEGPGGVILYALPNLNSEWPVGRGTGVPSP